MAPVLSEPIVLHMELTVTAREEVFHLVGHVGRRTPSWTSHKRTGRTVSTSTTAPARGD
jgi:hypothetical protein